MNNEFFTDNEQNNENATPDFSNSPADSDVVQDTQSSRSFASEESIPPKYEHHTFESTPSNHSPRKKNNRVPTWIFITLCLITLFSVVVSATSLVALFKIYTSEPLQSGSNIIENILTNDPEKVEEHIDIADSPKSEGARTSDGALTVKEISEKVRPSVVGVTCQNSTSFASSSVGSGIIMSEDGYIITNNHVIEGMTTIQVVLDDGQKFDARLIGSDSRTDLAVIKIDATDLPKAEFGDSDMLEQGDPAIAIGNPAGLQLQNTVTYGIISAINRDIVVEDREMTLIQTDASINPGNSGGPLVNEFGQVIGINTIKVGISYYEGLGFAIPINTAKPIIDELISRGYIKGRPSIGISGETFSERDAAFYGLPAGLYIEYVHPYSDAFKKGIRRGDIITKMNGTRLTSTAEIKKIRDNFSAGDTITLTIYRNSKEVDVEVVLMDEATISNSTAEQN